MPRLRTMLAASWLALFASACNSAPRGTRLQRADDGAVSSRGGSTVIGREILARNDMPVLDLLRYRVPGITVSPTADCPEVILRGKSTIFTNSSATIYVDGERAVNTCVLTMLSTFHIDRVEIYPGGVPPRGYLMSPYGVILIYSMTGPEPN